MKLDYELELKKAKEKRKQLEKEQEIKEALTKEKKLILELQNPFINTLKKIGRGILKFFDTMTKPNPNQNSLNTLGKLGEKGSELADHIIGKPQKKNVNPVELKF